MLSRPTWAASILRVVHHAAQFEQRELLAVAPNSHLPIKDRPARVELDQQTRERHQGREGQEKREGRCYIKNMT
jgi:hypothetical protein